MPIENEFRYVLQGDCDTLSRNLRALPDSCVERIEQGDLSTGVRLRWALNENDGSVIRTLTVKRKIDGDTVEIETAVSEADFKRLWPSCDTRHGKTRFRFQDGEHHWDVDLFGDPTAPYFMRAECEAPEHVDTTPPAHPILEPFLLHVAGKDKGFSSRRLSDPKYAKKLLKRLLADLEYEPFSHPMVA